MLIGQPQELQNQDVVAIVVDNRRRLPGKPHNVDALEGVEGNEDFRQRLPIHGWLRGDYQFTGKWHLTGEVFANTTGLFPRVGVGRDLPGGQRLDLSYDLEANALGLSYAWQPYLQLSLLADDTDWEQAHTLGVGLELRIPW